MLKWRARSLLTDKEKSNFLDKIILAVNTAMEEDFNLEDEPLESLLSVADKLKPVINEYIEVFDDKTLSN